MYITSHGTHQNMGDIHAHDFSNIGLDVSHASMVAMNHLLLLLISNHLRPICCCHGCLWWFNLFAN
jgi:hypothetical protein